MICRHLHRESETKPYGKKEKRGRKIFFDTDGAYQKSDRDEDKMAADIVPPVWKERDDGYRFIDQIANGDRNTSLTFWKECELRDSKESSEKPHRKKRDTEFREYNYIPQAGNSDCDECRLMEERKEAKNYGPGE